MGKLIDFLTENPVDGITAEIPISERFKDESGKLMKFRIRALTSDEYTDYQKRALKGKNEFDLQLYYDLLVINQTEDPNFKDAAAVAKMGCAKPEGLLHKSMLPGEIDALASGILKLSGFNVDIDLLREEAKN